MKGAQSLREINQGRDYSPKEERRSRITRLFGPIKFCAGFAFDFDCFHFNHLDERSQQEKQELRPG